MTYNVQPLESFRLGKYQLPIPCFFCGHDNLFDAANCRHCSGPMEVGRSASDSRKKSRPQIIATLGADNVGKTVFLGMMLDILSRQGEELNFTTRSAASLSIPQEAMSALARGEFPPPTSRQPEDWKWAHFQLRRRSGRNQMDAFMVDIAGAALLDAIDSRRKVPLVDGLLRRATGAMLLIDAERVQAGDKDEEFFGMKILGHLIDVIERQTPEPVTQRRFQRAKTVAAPPIVIVLTKADQCDSCVDSAERYVQAQLPKFWQMVRDRFPVHEYFATSVVGACADLTLNSGQSQRIPLRVEPRGIMPPFRWLVGQFTP